MDYTSIINEAFDRSGHDDLVSSAHILVSLAETTISRKLRISGLEATVTLNTDSSGVVDLPSDYQDLRTISTVNGIDMGCVYPTNLPYSKLAFYIQNNKLYTTQKSSQLVLRYYKNINSLRDNVTNYISNNYPELYIESICFHIHSKKREFDKARVIGDYVASLIDEINDSDKSRTQGRQTIRIVGPE